MLGFFKHVAFADTAPASYWRLDCIMKGSFKQAHNHDVGAVFVDFGSQSCSSLGP